MFIKHDTPVPPFTLHPSPTIGLGLYELILPEVFRSDIISWVILYTNDFHHHDHWFASPACTEFSTTK